MHLMVLFDLCDIVVLRMVLMQFFSETPYFINGRCNSFWAMFCLTFAVKLGRLKDTVVSC